MKIVSAINSHGTAIVEVAQRRWYWPWSWKRSRFYNVEGRYLSWHEWTTSKAPSFRMQTKLSTLWDARAREIKASAARPVEIITTQGREVSDGVQ